MKKKIIEVDTCHECPFKNYSYDDFSMGDMETHSCILLMREWTTHIIDGHPVQCDYFIKFFKNGNVKSKNKKTLDNCPLLVHEINVSLK